MGMHTQTHTPTHTTELMTNESTTAHLNIREKESRGADVTSPSLYSNYSAPGTQEGNTGFTTDQMRRVFKTTGAAEGA